MLLLVDNTPVHTVTMATESVVIPAGNHPSYTPDMTPFNFFPQNEGIDAREFSSDEKTISTMESRFSAKINTSTMRTAEGDTSLGKKMWFC